MSLKNVGTATAYDAQITFKRDIRGVTSFDHRLWTERPETAPRRGQIAKLPLHIGDEIVIAEWVLQMIPPEHGPSAQGNRQRLWAGKGPLPYTGDDIKIWIKIFARDLEPCEFDIQFSGDEIRSRTLKRFPVVTV